MAIYTKLTHVHALTKQIASHHDANVLQTQATWLTCCWRTKPW